MKAASFPFFVFKVLAATLTGVYVFEHPRAWAGELPAAASTVQVTPGVGE
ncbi:MAG: hypothetical protein AAGJ79_15380 [Verrucomicrobiota bacterium]